jgi:uncharacterized protein (TIGR00297 family)
MSRMPGFPEDGPAFGKGYAEAGRQLVHVSMGAGALLLRWITATEAMVIAGAALVFNVYALPHIASSLFRPAGVHRRVDPGVVFYPASVLLLLMLFPDRLDIVAAAWGIMAAGDGIATIAGRQIPSAPIPWNRERTIAGSAAFVLIGGAAGGFLCCWCAPRIIPPPYHWFCIWMPVAAALAAAAAETLPIRLDDNISVPAAAAAVLWSTSLLNDELVLDTVAHTTAILPLALAANAGVAAIGYFAGTVTRAGALCGAAIGIIVIGTAGWGAWGLLLSTFALAAIASRLGLRRKMMLGIAEPRGGRRGVSNALANTGIAAVAAILSATTYAVEPALVAFVAALAAGGSDTVASEIGKAWGRRTILVTTLGRVPPGTSGAISLEGTAAGVAAAFGLATIAVAFGLVARTSVAAIMIGVAAGSLVESSLGATFESEGILDNHVLNVMNTAVAALCAVWLATTVGIG